MGNIQRRVSGRIYDLLLSAAISHFIYRRRADRYHKKKLIIDVDMLIAFATFIMVLAIPHISSEPALLGAFLCTVFGNLSDASVSDPANAFFLQRPILGYGCRGGRCFTKCTAIMCRHLHTHGGIQYHAPTETPCAGISLPAESRFFP